MQLVKDWLENSYSLEWLMIIDNVDNSEAFFKENTYGKPLVAYVPQSAKGSLLYTTRNRDIGVDLTQNRDPIMIPSMSQAEAQQLLGEPLMSGSTVKDRQDLLEELDYLPFATTQAVAYMTKRLKSISQYLGIFRQSDSTKIRLLKHEFSDCGREGKRMESLATTFVVSFEYLRKDHPHAADLLSMMSFFDRDRIPGDVLHRKDANPLDFEDAIGLLVAFSFVTQYDSREGASYGMHRLIYLATRAWLSEIEPDGGEASSSKAMQQAAENMHFHLVWFLERGYYVTSLNAYDAEAQKRRSEYWTLVRLPSTHLKALLALQLQNPSNETRLAQATLHLVYLLYLYGTHSFVFIDSYVQSHAAKALEIRIEILGPDHLDTCISMVVVAYCKMFSQDNFMQAMDHEAVRLLRQGMDGFYKSLELAHKEVMYSILIMSKWYYYQRDEAPIRMAKSWFQEMLENLETLPDRGENASSVVCPIIYGHYSNAIRSDDRRDIDFRYHCWQQLWVRYHHVWSEALKDEGHHYFGERASLASQ